jgi:uncharacterized protein YodC (DUF2158 family)
MENFKPGDVVRLKSGGPLMTVSHPQKGSSDQMLWCEWFAAVTGADAKEVKGHAFAPEMLVKSK